MPRSVKAALGTIAAVAAAAVAAGSAAAGGGPGPGLAVGWDGVLAADGATRLVAMPGETATTLARVRVRDGRVLNFAAVPGSLGIPVVAYDGRPAGLSPDGRRLVLTSFTPAPQPGATTDLTVVNTRSLRVVAAVGLEGSFSYDAASPDGRYLYMTEYLPATRGANPYRIRVVDVRAARLLPRAIVDPKEPGAMQGAPVTRADGEGGRWAYTLYASRPGQHFIHALDTVRRKAFCIDLPWSQATARMVHTVRMRPAGPGRLELYQPGRGRLAVLHTDEFRVTQLAEPTA